MSCDTNPGVGHGSSVPRSRRTHRDRSRAVWWARRAEESAFEEEFGWRGIRPGVDRAASSMKFSRTHRVAAVTHGN